MKQFSMGMVAESDNPTRDFLAFLLGQAIQDTFSPDFWLQIEALTWLFEFGPLLFPYLDIEWSAVKERLVSDDPITKWQQVWEKMPPKNKDRYR